MKMSPQIRAKIIDYMHANKIRPVDFSERTGMTGPTLSRILSGKVVSISDDSAEKICKEIGLSLADLLLLSLGVEPRIKVACEEAVPPYGDRFGRLASWLRTSADQRAIDAVFSVAEMGGFPGRDDLG